MKKIIFLLLVSFFSISSFAVLAPPGAVSMATGGSGRGATEPVDSVLLNPSLLALLPTKFFSASYTSQQWGLTISDNGKDALFPAALAFVRSDVNDFKTQQLALALSYAYKKMISVGVNVSMLEYERSQKLREQKYRQTAADIGVMYSPSPEFGIGFVANKISSSKVDLDESLQKQKTIGAGAQYTFANAIRFRYDMESAPDNKTDRLVYMGGIETFLNDWMIFRVGYQNNNVVAKNYSSLGLGFSGPQFGLHYAYISNVADGSDDKHSIDLGIPF